MTINESGDKKTVAKLQAVVKAVVALVPGQSDDEVPTQLYRKAP
jgi:hypothetical protein